MRTKWTKFAQPRAQTTSLKTANDSLYRAMGKEFQIVVNVPKNFFDLLGSSSHQIHEHIEKEDDNEDVDLDEGGENSARQGANLQHRDGVILCVCFSNLRL
eukprot:Gregarina_sp_Pseudo_9__1793@NODE_221_length_3552_cov_20_581554_g206_i0_p5_GENE_NODE_221_length_3552_cov_20_581554_g206_i0NODE_221_length_3552_cov_20_581554_g206_i0_p5_ORF_typecomplete_len101_score13_06_NODE_221_length_3552_cov_20_581554_g206_i08101112